MIGFMDNKPHPVDTPMEIFITTKSDVPVSVQISGVQANVPHLLMESFLLYKDQVHLSTVHQDYRLHGTELSRKGIEITANHDIIVYGINREALSNDGYLALPTDAIGSEYYTVSYSPASLSTLALMIGVQNNTKVAVRLADNPNVTVNYQGHAYGRGDTINVVLNQFDTFQINSTGDLTGTYIKASYPLTVLSGNKKTKIGANLLGGSRDHLVEQLLPVKSWGKNFALIPLPERQTGDEYRFVASQDNTQITIDAMINGKHVQNTTTIQKAGQYAQIHFTSATYAHVTSDKPIEVMQFADNNNDNDLADPSMITVPPVEQYAADYTFTTPTYSKAGDYTNYFMFIIENSQKDGLRIDGHPLTGVQYHNIPGTTLVSGYVSIPVGTHTVSHTTPNSVFAGLLFGKAMWESYGFPVGLLVEPINGGCQPTQMERGDRLDNDCDGTTDEETCNGFDDDEDGKIDEDCNDSSTGIIG